MRRSGDRIGTTENGGQLEDAAFAFFLERKPALLKLPRPRCVALESPAVRTVSPVSPFEGQRFLQNERRVHLLLCGSWLAAARSSPWTRSELNLRLGAKAGKQRDASHTGRAGWPGRPSACIPRSFSWVFRKSNTHVFQAASHSFFQKHSQNYLVCPHDSLSGSRYLPLPVCSHHRPRWP